MAVYNVAMCIRHRKLSLVCTDGHHPKNGFVSDVQSFLGDRLAQRETLKETLKRLPPPT